MSKLTTTAFGILVILFSAQSIFAKEWRGIVPLHSVRVDVERLLGPPSQRSPYGAYYYNLPDELAVIHFQNVSCNEACGFGWNVPIGTVISIGVLPKGYHRKKRFALGGDFIVNNAGGGFVYYTNERDGESLEKYNERPTLITYSATKKDAALQCSSLRDCIADFFPKFDEYANLSFEDEKARLDNYVIQMNEMIGRGAIVVVGENRAARNRLLKRAERAKRYLVHSRGFEPERLLIVDGGYHSSSYTQLHLYPIGEMGRIYLFPENDPTGVAPRNRLRLKPR